MNWDEIPNIEVPMPDFGMQPQILDEVQDIPLGEAPAGRRAPPKKPTQPRAFGRQGFATGVSPMLSVPHGLSGHYLMANASKQYADIGGQIAKKIEDTFRDENDSRVSQLRELQRMEHEREIERMRQETERMKVEALLKRLEQESDGGRTVRFPGGSITHGGGNTVKFPGGSITHV